MSYAIIIGASVLAFLSAYIFFKLGENTGSEHIVLQLLMISMIVGSVSVLGGAVFKDTNCHLVAVNSTTTNDVIDYEYGQFCYDEPTPQSNSFIRLTSYFYRLFMTYVIVYFIYRVLIAFGVLDKMYAYIKSKTNGYKKYKK